MQDTKLIRRYATMLLALAALAERAAGRSWPVRFLVLWILRPAEARAREFIVDMARDLGYSPDSPGSMFFQDDDKPTDAVCLALRFEALARLLDDLRLFYTPDAAPNSGFAHGRIKRRPNRFSYLVQALHDLAGWVEPYPDTS